MLVLVAATALAAGDPLAPPELCVVVDIDGIGPDRLEALEAVPGVRWWVELDQALALFGDEGLLRALPARSRVVQIHRSIGLEEWRLARGLSASELADLDAVVVARGGSYALLSFDPGRVPALEEAPQDAGQADWRTLLSLPEHENLVLARQWGNSRPAGTVVADPDIEVLVAMVDAQRWFGDLEALASYNRYTPGPEILDARDWIVQQLDALPDLVVTTQAFPVWDTTGYNVVATLVGPTRPDDWYIVGGHYDSVSEDPYAAAPGAEDNASGCAGVLEMARIFAFNRPEATVLFICYAGEEQGLYGSEFHAESLVTSGDAVKVKGMLDMDMIAYTADAELDCLLESEPQAQLLVDAFAAAAATYTTLEIVTSMYAWGSDHVPYLDRGMPALLTIENDWDQYPDYHSTLDLPSNLGLDMGREILRMNVAARAELAGSRPALLFADGFESGDMSAWSGTSGSAELEP